MSVPALQLPGSILDANQYANTLLADLGCAQVIVPEPNPQHPAVSWAQSGLMMLTGHDSPIMCLAPIAACADGALEALKSFGHHQLKAVSGSGLLAERAALIGLGRQGDIAPGGSCRLLRTLDGYLALNLAREDDWAMMPAWLEDEQADCQPGDWDLIASLVCSRKTGDLIERGRLLGLPVAKSSQVKPAGWYQSLASGTPSIPGKHPLVLDLSALWAGPLCGHLLERMGARVIKVESMQRPDGARRGNADFYDLLNAGKASVALDFTSERGRQQLLGLIENADIVIEAARPRALRQMGIVAEDIVQSRNGLTWVSITAYGREGCEAEWVGFGDDVAVAAGLSDVMMTVTGEPMFVGDAIADPLTGIHAALAAWSTHQQGGGQLVSLAMRDVVSHCMQFDLPHDEAALKQRYRDWSQLICKEDVRLPQPRYTEDKAPQSGADTENILAEFGL